MDKIKIIGGQPLNGRISISGAKNAALPLMTAGILTEGTLRLEHVPHLTDVRTLGTLLGSLGIDVGYDERPLNGDLGAGDVWTLNGANINSQFAPYDLVSKMRASFWVLGPLLARFGQAKVSLPGGCAIGARPVDLYIKGLQAMGAEIEIDEGYVIAKAPKGGLVGATVRSKMVSVGVTHTLMMAATLANGETVLENSASEPEVKDLADCLIKMGARIEGAGTSTIRIQGVDSLMGATHRVLPDRIEAGSFAMAAAMTGGELTLCGVKHETIESALSVLRACGVHSEVNEDEILIRRNEERLLGTNVVTQVYPGFPTDLQAQFMSLMTTAKGDSDITETIFENRFMHVQELARFGADISLHGDKAIVHGVERLKGAPVMASDLRASAALIIAGLAAEGETTISRVYHLDRGFDRIEEKLSRCGALITREKE
ncbi:MAG: UDP-N-acetylglucosamine 1-carboxyvinyltransferase [Parvibaculaceae bacterium]|jgi:UDP-N-acetylglucosamine 1-carboxyvinyltransferase|nr:UDP-N-acetylglucosamine 1-carboxyvinyltransferase [Parvibaculaceae bacterium]